MTAPSKPIADLDAGIGRKAFVARHFVDHTPIDQPAWRITSNAGSRDMAFDAIVRSVSVDPADLRESTTAAD